MRIFSALLGAGLSVVAAVPVMAAQYTFSFTPSTVLLGSSYSGSGIFTTSDTAMIVGNQTAYAILSISGTVNNSAIAAPAAAGTSYGNYFTTGGYFLDGSGTRFNTVGGTQVAFFNQSTNNLYRVNSISPGGSFYVNATSAAVAAVPEPASWAMMVGGFGLIGAAMRRRKLVTVSYG